MFTPEITQRMKTAGIAAVVTIEDPLDAVSVARALLAGGVGAIELTYRTAAAGESIRRIRAEVPEVLIGAGTLLSAQLVDDAIAAGAAFGVAPGCNPRTIQAAQQRGLPFAPGVATASDIEIALEHRCRVLKYFPAETSGGLPHLTNVAAPFAHLGVQYIPLGGINAQSLANYVRSPLVACVGGSWLAKADVIKAKAWSKITEQAAEAVAIIRTTRG